MKILWVPQISSKSTDGKILLMKDSNMAFLLNMRNSDLFKMNEITVAFEFSGDDVPIDDLAELKEAGIRCIFDSSRKFTNAKMERFNFNTVFFTALRDKEQYDIVFVNEPTKIQPLRSIFFMAQTVCYNHWMACKNMTDLALRQYEDMVQADVCLMNSNYAISEFNNFYRKYNLPPLDIRKLQPSFSSEMKPIKEHAKSNIIYNHRLSTDPYYLSAFQSLVEICNVLENMVKEMPTIYFTNPSGKSFDVTLYKPYFKTITLGTQDEYKRFLESDEISIHLNTFFQSEGMWSMSTVDAIAAGNIALMPRKYGYAEIMQDDYEGYCDNQLAMAMELNFILNGLVFPKAYSNSCVLNHSGKILGDELDSIFCRMIINKDKGGNLLDKI